MMWTAAAVSELQGINTVRNQHKYDTFSLDALEGQILPTQIVLKSLQSKLMWWLKFAKCGITH